MPRTAIPAPKLPSKAGRPTAAKYSLAIIGPSQTDLSQDILDHAFIMAQTVAKAGQLCLCQAIPGLAQAISKGAKSGGGVCLGFAAAANRTTLPPTVHHIGFDTIIYTNHAQAQVQQALIESADGLIIIANPSQPLPDLLQPLQRSLPVGILTQPGLSTQYIGNLVELLNSTKTKINYHTNPRQLVQDVLKQVKEYRRQSAS